MSCSLQSSDALYIITREGDAVTVNEWANDSLLIKSTHSILGNPDLIAQFNEFVIFVFRDLITAINLLEPSELITCSVPSVIKCFEKLKDNLFVLVSDDNSFRGYESCFAHVPVSIISSDLCITNLLCLSGHLNAFSNDNTYRIWNLWLLVPLASYDFYYTNKIL